MNKLRPKIFVYCGWMLLINAAHGLECAKNIFPRNTFATGRLEAVIATADGGLLLASGTSLIKQNALGDTVFQRTYGNAQLIRQVIETVDGGIVAVGSDRFFSSAWIARLDVAGQVLWERRINGRFGLTAVVEAFDEFGNAHGFAITGSEAELATVMDIFVARVDVNGNFIWQRRIGDNANQAQVANAIIQTSDGGFALVGKKGNGAWFLKIDASGNVLLSQEHRPGPKTWFQSIIQTSDGGMLIAGSVLSPSGFFDGLLLKLDALGTTEFSYAYDEPDSETSFGTVSSIDFRGQKAIVETPAGGFALAGTISFPGTTEQDGWLLKVDSVGVIEFQRSFGATGRDSLTDIVYRPGEGYVLAGVSRSFNGSVDDGFLLLTDENGDIVGCGLVNMPSVSSAPVPLRVSTPMPHSLPATAVMQAVSPQTNDGDFFVETQCPLINSDGDGIADDIESKYGADPNDSSSYPILFTTNAFILKRVTPTLGLVESLIPWSATYLASDGAGTPIPVLHPQRGFGNLLDRQTGREQIIAKSSNLESAAIEFTAHYVVLNKVRTVTKTVVFDLAQAAPYPELNEIEVVFDVVVVNHNVP